MADSSKIEWTDATWNPVRGCARVSEGCRNCYAEHQALRITRFDRAAERPEGAGAYDGLVILTSQGPKWTGLVKLVADKLDEPLSWRRPRRIFVNSMSDLFHEGVPDEYIAQVFAVMICSPWHTYQVLTKRPLRMVQLLTSPAWGSLIEQHVRRTFEHHPKATTPALVTSRYSPPRNVHLGVSAEDQRTADERIPQLLYTPAAVRFVSAEPLLGPINLTRLQGAGSLYAASAFVDGLRGGTWGSVPATGERLRTTHTPLQGLDWVIVGGESGRGSRLMKAEWAQAIRNQCQLAGVPFFFKQWGGADKKEAGRLLDGREWNEFPEASHA